MGIWIHSSLRCDHFLKRMARKQTRMSWRLLAVVATLVVTLLTMAFITIDIFGYEHKCMKDLRACSDQESRDLIEWIRDYWIQDCYSPNVPLNFSQSPVMSGQIGVPVMVDRLLNSKLLKTVNELIV